MGIKLLSPIDPIDVTGSNPFRKPSHIGKDLSADHGSLVSAMGDGKVVYAGFHFKENSEFPEGDPRRYVGSYGYTVVIEHEEKCKDGSTKYYYTLYAHLSNLYVEVGQQVSAGDWIGQVGNTGYVYDKAVDGRYEFHEQSATASDGGVHLHYELIRTTTYSKITFSPRNDTEAHKLFADLGGGKLTRDNPDEELQFSCEPPKKPSLDLNPPAAPNPPRRDPLALDLDGNNRNRGQITVSTNMLAVMQHPQQT
jgi:murein DD-endopeptidase MepM/ murein hydrolase activator NlpD